MATVTIEIPDDAFAMLRRSPKELSQVLVENRHAGDDETITGLARVINRRIVQVDREDLFRNAD